MASSYKKLQDYDHVLWGIGSPVVVEKMRLCFDRTYGVNVLQITFRNVSNLKMYGLSVSLILKDENGKQIHAPVEFNYYAMEVATGKTFGSGEDIVVEKEAVNFEVTVTGADLAGGVRLFEKSRLEKMPVGQPLEILDNLKEPFLNRLQQTFPKARPVVVCDEKNSYWRCVCDHIWPDDIDKCTFCKTERAPLMEILPTLRAEERKRKEEEKRRAREEAERRLEEAKKAEEERARLEEEKRLERERKLREEEEQRQEEERKRKEAEEARKAKRKKILLISCPIAAAIILMIVLAIILKKKSVAGEEMAEEATKAVARIEAQEETRPEETKAKPEPKPEQLPEPEKEEKAGPLLIMGANISENADKTIWRLFGKTKEELEDFELIEIPDGWCHTYMDDFIGAGNVEDAARSSLLIVPRDDDQGLRISLYNISFFTEDDFVSLVRDIGYENADVIVAAPEECSGSTAMLGLYIKDARMRSASGQAIGKVKARGSINVRSGPGTEYPVLTTVSRGSELEVLEITDNGWLKITWPESEVGYAYTSNSTGNYYDFY